MIKTSEGIVLSGSHFVRILPDLLNCKSEDFLFINIETTGLSPKSADIYLIGCAYHDNGNWHVCQFFAETPDQEKRFLRRLLNSPGSIRYLSTLTVIDLIFHFF